MIDRPSNERPVEVGADFGRIPNVNRSPVIERKTRCHLHRQWTAPGLASAS